MTPAERRQPEIIDGSRRSRIANGIGHRPGRGQRSSQAVPRDVSKMMKRMGGFGSQEDEEGRKGKKGKKAAAGHAQGQAAAAAAEPRPEPSGAEAARAVALPGRRLS